MGEFAACDAAHGEVGGSALDSEGGQSDPAQLDTIGPGLDA